VVNPPDVPTHAAIVYSRGNAEPACVTNPEASGVTYNSKDR
jgi:hypothetical protein